MRHALTPAEKPGRYSYDDALYECERRGGDWHPKRVAGSTYLYTIARNPKYTKAHRTVLRKSEAVNRLKMMNEIISEELGYSRTRRLWQDRFDEWKEMMNTHQNPEHVWHNETIVGTLHTFVVIELNRMWKAGEVDPVRPNRFLCKEKRGKVEDIPWAFFRPAIDDPRNKYRAATDAEWEAWQQEVSSRTNLVRGLEGGASDNL